MKRSRMMGGSQRDSGAEAMTTKELPNRNRGRPRSSEPGAGGSVQALDRALLLLELLADHLGVALEINIVKDLDEIFDLLNRGEADIIGLGLTVTKERAKRIAFTEHHNVIHQVLVQRKPENWRRMKLHEIDRQLITSPIDLIDKKVHVWGGSSYYSRLVHLSDEIGGDIDIVEVPGNLSTEDLIAQVARGEIDYTVADENIA